MLEEVNELECIEYGPMDLKEIEEDFWKRANDILMLGYQIADTLYGTIDKELLM